MVVAFDKRAVQLVSYNGAVRYCDWIIWPHKTAITFRWTAIAHQKLAQSKPILRRKVIVILNNHGTNSHQVDVE